MFYQPSSGRDKLHSWLLEVLPCLRPDNSDARLLDEITSSEILDLVYTQGGSFDSAIAAHALFPTYAEENERGAVPSQMSVTFPADVEPGSKRVELSLHFRCARPSELKIGQGGTTRVTNPRKPVPSELLQCTIEGTHYDLKEPGGSRLRSLAGPLRFFETTINHTIKTPEGAFDTTIAIPLQPELFGHEDKNGELHLADSGDGLIGRQSDTGALKQSTSYLWAEFCSAIATLEIRWVRAAGGQLIITVRLKNHTPRPTNPESKDLSLSTLLLPVITLRLGSAVPNFPPLQYAEAKETMLRLSRPEERAEEAERRLYSVRQSGCIATQSHADKHTVVLTTFGIFDTPREQPEQGPEISQLTSSPDAFLSATGEVTEELSAWVKAKWQILSSVISAAASAFKLIHLHSFQWEGIWKNIEFLASDEYRKVTVVRAPTGAGKTIVFFVNAAINALAGRERSTSVLMFPTRLLNEDMFRRLIIFISHLRSRLPDSPLTGGILMGMNDPLYKLLLQPETGEAMHHYGSCPQCQSAELVAAEIGSRIVAQCARCSHTIDYMFNPREVSEYLPDIIIATPDKLFHDATAQGLNFVAGLLGTPVNRCDQCHRACPRPLLTLKPDWVNCSAFYKSHRCPGTFTLQDPAKLIRYIGFDEVHSLYGESATYLSMFLANLDVIQCVLASRREAPIRYETATATISNEIELLEAITRRQSSKGEIHLVPTETEMTRCFRIVRDRVRHRVLITLPTKVTSREAFIRSTLNSYIHFKSSQDLIPRLSKFTDSPEAWAFILGYIFKKQEGSDLRRALADMYRNTFGNELRVEFLSGEAPKDQISSILRQAYQGDIDLLLANLVISLGVDIHNLNHMLMLGVPRGFTEYVQTAGRTGRGHSPGHVHIILQPFYARDAYLYRHFHAVLTDVSGYYDILPVRSTNIHLAKEMVGNVAHSLLNALCMNLQQPKWANARSTRDLLSGIFNRLVNGICTILCNDPALENDIRDMATQRLLQIQDELVRRTEFLQQIFKDEQNDWLIFGLRGRSGSTVRMICRDQDLLDILQRRTQNSDQNGQEQNREI